MAQVADPSERKRATEMLMDRAQEADSELSAWYTAQLEGVDELMAISSASEAREGEVAS